MKINRTDLPGRARELAAAIQKRYPKADEYPYRSWSYPQGYLLMGFIHLWEKTGDELYYQYVWTMWRRTEVSGALRDAAWTT